MTHIEQFDLTCPTKKSYRVEQVRGLFGLPQDEFMRETFQVEVPNLSDSWSIGLITGPSGSGKTTVARRIFRDNWSVSPTWRNELAVIDQFGKLPLKQITSTLMAVGMSSPPAWIKPYHVLSTGEQFRCDLAAALLGRQESADSHLTDSHLTNNAGSRRLLVFDEFTSVVDRQVARTTSMAISKAIRRDLLPYGS